MRALTLRHTSIRVERRHDLLHGKHPPLSNEKDGPFKLGQRIVLEGNARYPAFSVRIEKLIDRKGKVQVHYSVKDDRPRLLAKQNGLVSPPQYTTVPARAIADAGEAIDEDTQREQTTRGHERAAERQNEIAAQDLLRRQKRAVRELLNEALNGCTLADGQALLAAIQRDIDQSVRQ